MLDFGYYNMDCMEGMKGFPDDYFDLAIVDPPYGDGLHAEGGGGKGWFTKYNQKVQRENEFNRFGGRFDKYKSENEDGDKVIEWDIAPPKEYFDELFRISKNQIIWGGNYFELPPTRCFLIWRKLTISEQFSMAMAEYAWTSFSTNAKVFEKAPQDKSRFHPTQKPVALYKWILANYANDGDLILDTHVGSASSLIACEEMGFKYVGFEIDENYYKQGKERLEQCKAQVSIIDLMSDWRLP